MNNILQKKKNVEEPTKVIPKIFRHCSDHHHSKTRMMRQSYEALSRDSGNSMTSLQTRTET
jgi:hypothetical protein